MSFPKTNIRLGYSRSLWLRLSTAIILLVHGISGMFNGGIYDFGTLFLDRIGFAPFGLMLAWLIKLSHIACAVALLSNKWLKPNILITIFILLAGIVLVHYKDGWFVVGGGRNGMEFNFLLIFVLIQILANVRKKKKHV